MLITTARLEIRLWNAQADFLAELSSLENRHVNNFLNSCASAMDNVLLTFPLERPAFCDLLINPGQRGVLEEQFWQRPKVVIELSVPVRFITFADG